MLIRQTGLAAWEPEFPFPGSLTSTFIKVDARCRRLPTPALTDFVDLLCRLVLKLSKLDFCTGNGTLGLKWFWSAKRIHRTARKNPGSENDGSGLSVRFEYKGHLKCI